MGDLSYMYISSEQGGGLIGASLSESHIVVSSHAACGHEHGHGHDVCAALRHVRFSLGTRLSYHRLGTYVVTVWVRQYVHRY